MNGYGKGLLAKQLASLIYKMSRHKTEEPISLEWKMGLNYNATSHPLTIAPNCSKSHPDTVTCRTSTRIQKPPNQDKMIFFMVNDTSSIENSNIRNQYDSSTSNFYSDFNFPSNNKINSELKDSSNNQRVYHQNIRGLRSKVSQLSNILYSDLPHMISITEHHLKDFEMEMKSLEYQKLVTNFFDTSIKMVVYVYRVSQEERA